jgi:Flp pilus assembly protein CpaB
MAQIGAQEKTKNRSVIVWAIIILLGLLAGIAAYSFISSQNETVSVLLVAKDIPPFTKITADYVQVDQMQKDAYNKMTVGGSEIYTKASDIVGSYSQIPLKKGELFYRFKIASPVSGRYVAQLYEKPGWKLVAVTGTALNAAAGQLSAGDYVDIYYKDANNNVLPLLKNAKVMDIKYGVNYFDSSAASTATDTASTGVASGQVTNINPTLGNSAYLMFELPDAQAQALGKAVLLQNAMYFAATKPIIAYTQYKTASAAQVPVVIQDIEFPSSDTTADLSLTPMVIYPDNTSMLLGHSAASSAATSASATATGGAGIIPLYQGLVNSDIQFYVAPSTSGIAYTDFLAKYQQTLTTAHLVIVYDDIAGTDAKKITSISLVNNSVGQ